MAALAEPEILSLVHFTVIGLRAAEDEFREGEAHAA
ncbi:MAG: hypothetical protein ACI8TV_000847 [Porticoccaceae bacterium]|jgi:hypothetical protein